MFFRIFGWSLAVTVVSLITAYFYGGTTALILCFFLGILEISLSFDNAVVNATVLRRMSRFWQQLFLTVGILIAVFGMRLVFPIAIVSVVSGLGPIEALQLALAGGDVDTPGTYAYILNDAHPQIAGFGGMFLLMLFLNYMLDSDREHLWLRPIERAMGYVGRIDKASVLIAAIVLVLSSQYLAEPEDSLVVLVSGLFGLITYLAVNGLGNAFEGVGEDDDEGEGEGDDRVGSGTATGGGGTATGGGGTATGGGGTATATATATPETGTATKKGPSGLAVVTGRAAFFLFLYLEVLDATFSFDGVIGAFAITSDPIIIALGLGLIGAMFVRSITIYLVRQGTLDDYVYLESGAHWAIGALALILLLTIGIHINEIITGSVGVLIILAAFLSSLAYKRRHGAEQIGSGDADGPDDDHSRPAAVTDGDGRVEQSDSVAGTSTSR